MYSRFILMLQLGCLAKVKVIYLIKKLKPQITAQYCMVAYTIFYFKCVISQITSNLP